MHQISVLCSVCSLCQSKNLIGRIVSRCTTRAVLVKKGIWSLFFKKLWVCPAHVCWCKSYTFSLYLEVIYRCPSSAYTYSTYNRLILQLSTLINITAPHCTAVTPCSCSTQVPLAALKDGSNQDKCLYRNTKEHYLICCTHRTKWRLMNCCIDYHLSHESCKNLWGSQNCLPMLINMGLFMFTKNMLEYSFIKYYTLFHKTPLCTTKTLN